MLIAVFLVALIVVSPVTGFGEKGIRKSAIETIKKFYSPENLQLAVQDSERAQGKAEKMKQKFRLESSEPTCTATEVTMAKYVIPDRNNREISVISPKICGYIDSDRIAAEMKKFERIILLYLFGVTGIGIKFENRHWEHEKHDIRVLPDWIRSKNYRYRLIFVFKYALQQHFDNKPMTKGEACRRFEKTTKSTRPTDHSDKDSSGAHRSNLKLKSVSAVLTPTTQETSLASANPTAQDKIAEADQTQTHESHSSNTNKTPSRAILFNSNAHETDQSEIRMKPEGLDEGETEGTSPNSNPNLGTQGRVIPQKGNDTNQQNIDYGSTGNTESNNEINRDAQLCSGTPSSTTAVASFTTTLPDNLSLSAKHFNPNASTFVKIKSQGPLEPLLPAGYKRTIDDPQLPADLSSHHTPADLKPTESISISPAVPSPESEISEQAAIPKEPERSDADLTQRTHAKIMAPGSPVELQVPMGSSPPTERESEVMGTESVQLTSLVHNTTQKSQLTLPTKRLIDYSLPAGACCVTETLGNTISRKVSSDNTVNKVMSRGNEHIVHRCQNPQKPFGFVLHGLVIAITVQVGVEGSKKYGLVRTEICGNIVNIVQRKVQVIDENWIEFTLPEENEKWNFKREPDDRVKFHQAVDHGLRAFVKLYELPTTGDTDEFRAFVQYLNPEKGQPPYVTVAAQPFGKEDEDGEFVQLIIHISKDDRVDIDRS